MTREPLAVRALLGVVPQEIALYEELSARQNLRFFGMLSGLRGGELERRIEETLEFIDLRERQDERARNFSGGMKRRLNIGLGLLHRPQLVYMDEADGRRRPAEPPSHPRHSAAPARRTEHDRALYHPFDGGGGGAE